MHMKVPFLAILFLSVFQLTVYAIQNNDYSRKSFDEVLGVDPDSIIEIQMIDYSGIVHHTKEPEEIREILHIFNQMEYQRLRSDQTSYMPRKTVTISLFDENKQSDFLIPYGKETIIGHNVYRIRNGTIGQDVMLQILDTLQENETTNSSQEK